MEWAAAIKPTSREARPTEKSFGCLAGAGPTYIGLLSLFVHLHLFIFIYQKGREEK